MQREMFQKISSMAIIIQRRTANNRQKKMLRRLIL
jgi:hypothetical protein